MYSALKSLALGFLFIRGGFPGKSPGKHEVILPGIKKKEDNSIVYNLPHNCLFHLRNGQVTSKGGHSNVEVFVSLDTESY